MKMNRRQRRAESGQALVLVIIVLVMVSIVTPPILRLGYAAQRSAQTKEASMQQRYTLDTGIEDAMYQIENDLGNLGALDFFTPQLAQTPSMNDSTLSVQVEKVWLPDDLGYPVPITAVSDKSAELKMIGIIGTAVAADRSDDFESGDFAGGLGWDAAWATMGSAGIGDSARANSGDYHLSFAAADGFAERETDLLGVTEEPRLQFYARAGAFTVGDSAKLLVSTDGLVWDTVLTWSDGNDTDTYELIDVDLSSYGNSTEFWVAFDADLSGSTAAQDDFESGDLAGGAGWIGSWDETGDITLRSDGRQHGGNWHLRLQDDQGYLERELDLSGYDSPRLEMWARVRSFESGDSARLRVFDGLNWHDLHEWTDTDDDDTYHPYDVDLSAYPHVGPGNYKIRIEPDMSSSSSDYFYIDDLQIVEQSYFYVDDLVIGERGLVYKIEVAYTDAAVGAAWMDAFGVWLPRGFSYDGVVESNGITTNDPGTITPNYRGGTALEWDFSASPINLNPGGQLPIVRDITLRFTPASDPPGIFAWIQTTDGDLSWDTSSEIYRATAEAQHALLGGGGSSVEAEAYVMRGQLNREEIRSYGNYLAAGSALMVDNNAGDPDDEGKRETSIDGSPQSHADIIDVPDDAEVVAAWLYWSAFQQDSDIADETVDFMHPIQHYGEALGVAGDGNGDDVFEADNKPIDPIPDDESVYMYPKRRRAELLGVAASGNGNDTFNTAFSPIVQPPPEDVYLSGFGLLTVGDDYDIDYDTGFVKVTNDTLAGNVTIDYSVAGYDFLTSGADYNIDYATGAVTLTDDTLVGNVVMDYYASHWEVGITHAANDRYGTSLNPVVEETIYEFVGYGWSYMCFRDVTDLVGVVGNGEFAVRNVAADPATDESEFWGHFSYSGWSLIVVYESPSETAHQLYLYDPIHNAGDIPFYAEPADDVSFVLSNFYPPDGVVEGKLTYFIGEGDDVWDEDYIGIKGASQPAFTNLQDLPNNPQDNVINATPTTGVAGIDIDTFEIIGGAVDIGSDTAADVQIDSTTEAWNLIYLILSFKTDETMVPERTFSVSTMAYNYSDGS